LQKSALGRHEQAAEALLMGLRLNEGVDLAQLSARFGLVDSELVDFRRFAIHEQNGLLWREVSRVGVTEAGFPLLDALLAELVSSELVRA